MTASLPLLRPSPAGPRPVLWTCAEFHRLGDAGVFEGRRAMLIGGVILEEGPRNPPHAVTLELVDAAVRDAFGAGWRVRGQSPLVLGQDLDPEPDLAVVAGVPRGSTGHPTTAALVVEVADSSLAFDTNEKRLLYARAGVPDYWVVMSTAGDCSSTATRRPATTQVSRSSAPRGPFRRWRCRRPSCALRTCCCNSRRAGSVSARSLRGRRTPGADASGSPQDATC